jgi:hypothetical protein
MIGNTSKCVLLSYWDFICQNLPKRITPLSLFTPIIVYHEEAVSFKIVCVTIEIMVKELANLITWEDLIALIHRKKGRRWR